MEIIVTTGAGEGKTYVSAFDAALMKAGTANYNLIYLSSVIPKESVIQERQCEAPEKDYGNKLYVVMSRCDQYVFGKEAWAGLGWVQDKEGRGLFVEHKAESRDELSRLIEHSLNDMSRSRPYEYGEIHAATCGIECKNQPACAVIMAVYRSEPFSQIGKK